MQVTRTTKRFGLHPAALYSIMLSQAGTVEKALLELIMNSVDAKASSVQVNVTVDGFSVKDDGKGFDGETEIDNFFSTFGTPHTQGDATYGRFRMGRGQAFAFAKTVWRSSDFEMSVDVKENGDAYDFVSGLPTVKGCQIEGAFYTPLKPTELLTVVRNLGEMCQYVDIPVVVNDKTVSLQHRSKTWTFQDDDAYYLLNQNANYLAIYNLGVLVKESWASDYGIGGVVLSKKQLTVNMARNDVLVSQCEVWKRVTAKIRGYVKQVTAEHRVVKNEVWRTALLEQAISGDFSTKEEAYDAYLREPVFTLADGSHVSLTRIYNLMCAKTNTCLVPVVVAEFDSSAHDEDAHTTGFAVVLSNKMASRLHRPGLTSQELFSELRAGLSTVRQSLGDTSRYGMLAEVDGILARIEEKTQPAEFLRKFVREKMKTKPEKSLSKDERTLLNLIRDTYNSIFRVYSEGLRQIQCGQSNAAQAWTDGSTTIWINENLLSVSETGRTLPSVFAYGIRIATLLVHEMCHANDNQDTHVHGLEFYEAYEKKTCGRNLLANFATLFVHQFFKKRFEEASSSSTKSSALRSTEAKAINELHSQGMPVDMTTADVLEMCKTL